MDVKYDVILGELREGDAGGGSAPQPTISSQAVNTVASSPIAAEDNKVYAYTGAATPSIILPDISDNSLTHAILVDFKYSAASTTSALSTIVAVTAYPSQTAASWVDDPTDIPSQSIWRLQMTWSPLDSQWKVIPTRLG